MMEIKKVLIIVISMILLYQGAAFCALGKDFLLRPPSHFSRSTKEFIKDQQGLSSNETIKRKAVDKFQRKKNLAKTLGLPMAFIVLNAFGEVKQSLMTVGIPSVEKQEGRLFISAQKKEFQIAKDQYNADPKWKVYFVDYGENGSVDISKSGSIRIKVQGDGYIMVQLIDIKRRDSGGNWQNGLSRVYKVEPGREFIDVDISEFLDSDPSLDLTKVNKIIVTVGREAWGMILNLGNPDTNVTDYEFSQNRINKSDGIPILTHVNNIRKTQNEKRGALLASLREEIIGMEEFEVLSKGRFEERIKTIDGLKDKFLQKGVGTDSVNALFMLNYALMDSAQNSNLRRYILYILKDFLKAEMQGEDLLEPYVKQGKVTEPVVVSFPMFWFLEKEGRELYEYPDWSGKIVTDRRLVDKGVKYGAERSIISKTTAEHVLSREVIKRLDYWAIMTGIDPFLVNATAYVESWMGAHPEKFDNIMAIHEEDLYKALDNRGRELRETLLALYGTGSEDSRLDEVIVTGLILLEEGFNVFSGSSDFSIRSQGYNGYGWHPWLKMNMSKNPIIGKRIKETYNRIRGGALEDIVRETAKELGVEPSFLPQNLKGYRIDIREYIKKRTVKSLIISPNKDNRTSL